MILLLFFVTTPSLETNGAANSKANSKGEVNLAIWGGYLTDEMIQEFETQSGVKLKILNYSSNEELLAKIQMGHSGIDVAVPSDYMVEVLRKLNKLEPLETDNIEKFKSIDLKYLNQDYDPGNKFSVPYAWSTAGIAVNRDLYKEPITSWHDIFDNPKVAGKLALLDDPREVTAAALKMLGFSVNTTNPEEIKKAKDVILKVKPRVKLFTSNSVDILVNKEVAIAHAYSTDANQAIKKSKSRIEYIIPKEGGTRAIDNLIIVKGTSNKASALRLINYFMNEKTNSVFVKNILAGPVLKETFNLLPKDLQKNKALFPEASVLRSLESIRDLGEKNKLYEELWTEVKSN